MFKLLAKPVAMDLGFIFGSDGKDARASIALEKEIAKKLLENADVFEMATRVGAIQYESDARVLWRFGEASDGRTAMQLIDRLVRSRNGNNVLKALEIARDDLYFIKNGGRRDVPKTLILFIDETKIKDQRLEDTAKQLKDKGVKVIVIAMGPEVDKKDVAGIATDPSDLITLRTLSEPKEDEMSRIVAKSLPGKSIFVAMVKLKISFRKVLRDSKLIFEFLAILIEIN